MTFEEQIAAALSDEKLGPIIANTMHAYRVTIGLSWLAACRDSLVEVLAPLCAQVEQDRQGVLRSLLEANGNRDRALSALAACQRELQEAVGQVHDRAARLMKAERERDALKAAARDYLIVLDGHGDIQALDELGYSLRALVQGDPPRWERT